MERRGKERGGREGDGERGRGGERDSERKRMHERQNARAPRLISPYSLCLPRAATRTRFLFRTACLEWRLESCSWGSWGRHTATPLPFLTTEIPVPPSPLSPPSRGCTEKREGLGCTEKSEGRGCTEKREGRACTQKSEGRGCTEKREGRGCTEKREGRGCTEKGLSRGGRGEGGKMPPHFPYRSRPTALPLSPAWLHSP